MGYTNSTQYNCPAVHQNADCGVMLHHGCHVNHCDVMDINSVQCLTDLQGAVISPCTCSQRAGIQSYFATLNYTVINSKFYLFLQKRICLSIVIKTK